MRWTYFKKSMGLMTCMLLLSPFIVVGQILKGQVQDIETKEVLRYATVSIIDQNRRVVTQSDGTFRLDVSQINTADSITISYIGYQTAVYAIRDLNIAHQQLFQLHPLIYAFEPIIVTAKESKTQPIGFTRPSNLRTGWGDFSSSRGRMRGVVIQNIDCSNRIKSFAFRIRDNDWDSVAFRLDLVSFKDGKPGDSLLPENIIVRTGAKNKWVTVDLSSYGISHCGDILAILEWVDAWGTTGEYSNVLTLSLGKGKGTVFTKEADEYHGKLLTERSPLAMYIEVFKP